MVPQPKRRRFIVPVSVSMTSPGQKADRPVLPRNAPLLADTKVTTAESYLMRTSYAPRFVTSSTVMSVLNDVSSTFTMSASGCTRSIAAPAGAVAVDAGVLVGVLVGVSVGVGVSAGVSVGIGVFVAVLTGVGVSVGVSVGVGVSVAVGVSVGVGVLVGVGVSSAPFESAMLSKYAKSLTTLAETVSCTLADSSVVTAIVVATVCHAAFGATAGEVADPAAPVQSAAA